MLLMLMRMLVLVLIMMLMLLLLLVGHVVMMAHGCSHGRIHSKVMISRLHMGGSLDDHIFRSHLRSGAHILSVAMVVGNPLPRIHGRRVCKTRLIHGRLRRSAVNRRCRGAGLWMLPHLDDSTRCWIVCKRENKKEKSAQVPATHVHVQLILFFFVWGVVWNKAQAKERDIPCPMVWCVLCCYEILWGTEQQTLADRRRNTQRDTGRRLCGKKSEVQKSPKGEIMKKRNAVACPSKDVMQQII